MNLNELKCINENIDIDKYIEFREYVKSNMEHSEWLGDFSREDLKFILNNGSKIWIYYLGDEPVCSMMFIPGDEKSMKKFGLKIDYHKVADYGPMFVNPKYVGNGLQYQMLVKMDDYCIQKGYKYSSSTVHPDNIYSANNLLKDGFVLCGQKEFTRGLRNIYLKRLNK